MEDLGLEPIDPFTEDVFAGLDDHPTGLWHPTLSPAPPTAATHHQDVPPVSNACASTSSSCHEGIALPYDDMLPAPELPIDLLAHMDWHHQQAGQAQQQHLQHQHPSITNGDASVLEQHWFADACTAQKPEYGLTTAEPAFLAQEAAVTSSELPLPCSTDGTGGHGQSSISAATTPVAAELAEPAHPGTNVNNNRLCSAGSELSSVTDIITSPLPDAATTPVAAAAVVTSCAALLPDCDPATDDTRISLCSSSSSTRARRQYAADTASSTEQPPSLPITLAADEADRSASNPATALASSPSSESSVPDIDDVSEEQALVGAEQQYTSSTDLPPEDQQQQQQEQQQQKKQSIQEQQQCDMNIHVQLQQQQEINQAAPQMVRSTHLDCSDLNCFRLQSTDAVQVCTAASAALVSPEQVAGESTAAGGNTLHEAPLSAAGAGTSAASGDAELEGLCITAGEFGEFSSPNTSWHSCMTSASHNLALSTLSAHAGYSGHALFGAGSAVALARGGVGLATLLPSHQQQQASRGCRATPSRSSVAAPLAAPHLGGPPSQQEQRQEQHRPLDGMRAIHVSAQDDDLWQDVFPPSLGSSPATSDGVSALAAHNAEVAAAQATARRAAAATAAGTGSSPAAGCAAINTQHIAAVKAMQAAADDVAAGDSDDLGCSPATAAGFTAIDRDPAAAAAVAHAVAGGALSSSPATVAGFTTVGIRMLTECEDGGDISSCPAAAAGSTAAYAESVTTAEAVGTSEAAAATPAEGAELSTSPATAGGFTAVEASNFAARNAAAVATFTIAEAEAAAAATGEEHDDMNECHGVYYASAGPASGIQSQRFSPSSSANDSHNAHQVFSAAGQGVSMPFVPYHGLYPGQVNAAASTYVLRQSEMVDLSLSTSLHPGQLQQQQQQQIRPGWLTAHQNLPPAAAQAVERAVVALNDSYFYHGRPEQGMGGSSSLGSGLPSPGAAVYTAHPAGSSVATDAAAAIGAGLGATGVIGMAIRRAGMRQQWSPAHTHPQQDQQARHRLPSQHVTAAAGPFSGWHGPAVLGQWFSSTVQQPLAAATGRVASGAERLGGAASIGRNAAASAVRHSSNSTASAAESNSASAAAAAVFQTGSGGNSNMGVWDVGWGPDSFEDAVLVERTPDMPQSVQEQEDEAFRGLLFLGGRDSHGRPVVIVNTDAIPAGHNPAPRDAALAYIVKKLTPIVTKGPYVLVMVAFQHGPQFRLLPGVWCVRAYHSLPRAFRKHVKHVILLQPSFMVRAALALLYPFVSSKAHAKIKQVSRLLDIETATWGEVQVPHLGEPFLTALQHLSRPATAPPAAPHRISAHGRGTTVPVPGAMQRW